MQGLLTGCNSTACRIRMDVNLGSTSDACRPKAASVQGVEVFLQQPVAQRLGSMALRSQSSFGVEFCLFGISPRSRLHQLPRRCPAAPKPICDARRDSLLEQICLKQFLLSPKAPRCRFWRMSEWFGHLDSEQIKTTEPTIRRSNAPLRTTGALTGYQRTIATSSIRSATQDQSMGRLCGCKTRQILRRMSLRSRTDQIDRSR